MNSFSNKNTMTTSAANITTQIKRRDSQTSYFSDSSVGGDTNSPGSSFAEENLLKNTISKRNNNYNNNNNESENESNKLCAMCGCVEGKIELSLNELVNFLPHTVNFEPKDYLKSLKNSFQQSIALTTLLSVENQKPKK
jgi:hypothetical protein